MDTPPQSSADAITRLRDGLNHLRFILALPDLSDGADPHHFASSMLEALLSTLGLAFVFVQLTDPDGGPAIEVLRVAEWLRGPAVERDVREALDVSLGEAPLTWQPRARMLSVVPDLSLASAPLGLGREFGILVAGSQRADVSAETDRLVLDVAASRIVIGLQRAHAAAERTRADAALRQSERDSQAALDGIPGLVGLLTAGGEIQFVNRRVLEYSARTQEELRDWTTSDIVHPEDLPHVIEVFSQSISCGTSYEVEQRLRRSDGVYRWFQHSGYPFRDAAGQVARWCVLLTDIDERKRAEDALRESERALRVTVDSIPGLVAAHTPDGQVEFVNRQLLDYFGTTLDELKHWDTGDITHPDDLPRAIRLFTHSIETGDPFDFEVRSRRFDGVYRWMQSRGSALRDSNGHIVRWYNLLTDVDERKRAEEALATNERNLKLIIDTIPALAWSARTDGTADFFNQHYLDFVGLSAEQASGWGWTTAVHPDDLNGLAAVWQQALTSEQRGEAEVRLRRHDGEYRWFLFRVEPLHDETGHVVKWYGVNTDIEGRKRAEEELRRSEAFLAQGQRLTLTGSLWWEVSTGEVIWSDETFRIMDVPKSTKPTVELALSRVHPQDISLATEMIERSARDGVNMDFELRLLMSDDSVKYVHVVLHNMGRQPGKPEFVGALTDISERKRAEAELRRAYDHLTEAQRLSQTGSFTADLERDEHDWSDEFYRICEFEPGSTISIQRLGEIVHPEDVALYEGAIGRAMAGTNPDFYFRIVTSRGVVKHLRGFAHRIAERAVFVGAIQDVTASTMAQEALNNAGAELAHVSRLTAMSALTASIAHEVNQPLSGIITNAGTCLRMLDATPPDLDGARETARRTIRDGNRASDVVTRLRALFRKREFTLEPLDLNEATREVIALASNDLQRHRIILHSELPDGLLIVTGDRIQLQQVIANLLRNAADAMTDVHDRPRELRVQTGEDGEGAWLTVRDAGVGLPAQGVASLFDAFHTTKRDGMGIGLFVSRSIIERHHGQLWAESNNDGPGATFSFSIPTAPGSVSAPT